MDKYTEIVKEIQRGNQEARNMLENQLKQDYQYMVANVNDLAQAEGLLRSAIASAMANITSTSSPDGIGESVRRNLEWNLTRASQVRRDYNQGNNYGDGTVTFSQNGAYRMNNNSQGGYAGPAGYRNNGYVQQNTYNDRTNNYNQTNNLGGNNNAGYGQQSNINNGAGYGQRSNINNGSGYGQQNNINNAARPQTPSNTAPKTNNKKNFIKYALISAGILAIIIIGIVLYNVFFKDNSSKKVVSGIDDNTGNSTEDYSYQDDTEDTSYNDTETSDNNIASDTGYEIVIEDYFYYYSNEDAEGMKLCYLDCIRDSMEKDMYSSVSGANSMDDYWQVMENCYGSDFQITADIASTEECDASTVLGLESHIQTTYGEKVTIDRAIIANLHETCSGSLTTYSFDESIYVAYINGAWYMIGTVLQ
jgi:hypothetical protein